MLNFVCILCIYIYEGVGEDHQYLTPVLAHAIENALIHSLEKMAVLVLRCDGLQKNKNIPKYVAELLEKKYGRYNKIYSNNGKWEYDVSFIIEILLVIYMLILY